MSDQEPINLNAYDNKNVVVMNALDERNKIGRVKIPCRTVEDAVSLAINYWQATQPPDQAQRITDIYKNFDPKPQHLDARSQFTSTDDMRTEFGTRGGASDPNSVEFPFDIMISGNQTVLNERSLDWLLKQGFITSKKLPSKRLR